MVTSRRRSSRTCRRDDERAGAVDVGVAGEDVAGDRLLRAGSAVGAASSGSLTTSAVLPTARFAPLNVSSSATGLSLTQVTVIDTVAPEPPFNEYVNVSGVVPGGSLQ